MLPLMRKEFIHILRDPRSLYIAIGLPLVLLILFGYAITFDVNHIPVAVINQDDSSLSRDLISRVQASEYFDLRYLSNEYTKLERLLDEGKVKIILVIPLHFYRDLSKGKNTPLQFLIDGSDNNTALIALGYLSKIIQVFSSNIVLEGLSKQGDSLLKELPTIDVKARVWYNPGLRSTNFIVPGLIAVVMMILAAMLTSLTIAREWETGTMEQLIATPTKPLEIIIGKLTPYFFLGLIQMTLVVLTGTLLFKVPFKGSIFFLFVVAGLFLVCGLGIGLFISTVTKSQQLAFMLAIVLTMLPAFLLSGFIFPISSMPRIIQFFSYLVPAKYFLIALRGIFLKGNGLSVHWPEVLFLLIFGLLIILACTKRLKLSLE
jgi:ABC-2 type transport system permease protein